MIATGLWYISNNWLMKPNLRDQDVEWGFCFDVHLNAFIPILVILHFVQLFVYHAIIGQIRNISISKLHFNNYSVSCRKGDVRCDTARELPVAGCSQLLHIYHFPGLQLPQPADENTLLPRTPHPPGSLLHTDPLLELEPQQ